MLQTNNENLKIIDFIKIYIKKYFFRLKNLIKKKKKHLKNSWVNAFANKKKIFR